MARCLIVLLFSCLFLFGCSTVTPTGDGGGRRFMSLESAAADVRPVGGINFGESRRLKIAEESPYFENTRGGGRFEIVTLEGKAGDSYKLTAYSVCDCFGFKKWAVVPHLYLLDDSKNLISKDAVVLGARLRALTGVFPKDGKYHLFVVADAKSEGQKLDEVSIGVALPGAAFVPDLLSVAMTSHPTGVVLIEFAKQ